MHFGTSIGALPSAPPPTGRVVSLTIAVRRLIGTIGNNLKVSGMHNWRNVYDLKPEKVIPAGLQDSNHRNHESMPHIAGRYLQKNRRNQPSNEAVESRPATSTDSSWPRRSEESFSYCAREARVFKLELTMAPSSFRRARMT